MKKVLGIYIGDDYNDIWDETTVREQGMGGSETWATELASEFQRRGFHVIIFAKPSFWHFAEDGVEYVPSSLFDLRCQYQKFDVFIMSRRTDKLTPNLDCPSIYVMVHDMGVWKNNDYASLKLDKVCKLAYLSDWHHDFLKDLYPGLTDERMMKTINGIDTEMYLKNRIPYENKKNLMVWSSCPERGLLFFVRNIFPEIKKVVPDFELKVCTYLDSVPEEIHHIEGVEFVGRLNKKQLCELQEQAKILVYPNYGYYDNGSFFQETFCITVLENALCGNAVLALKTGGVASTLEGYSGLMDNDYINYWNGVVEADRAKLAKDMSEKAVKIMTDDKYRLSLAEEACEIAKNYTWANAVDGWLKEWGLKF